MKKILLVSDVKGWGGWVRGEYIQKYLSNEFDIDLIDSNTFNKYEKTERVFDYDLVYLLFHPMLKKKSVYRLAHNRRHPKPKLITIVTGFPTIKPIFYNKPNDFYNAKNNFLRMARFCSGILANNIKSLKDLKSIYSGRTFYAPRGVDPDVFYPMEKKDGKFTVAYVGKPVPQKGLNEVIRPACEKTGCKLILNDRNYTNALGPDEMREFYNQADVYLVASSIDGTPNPALEAAACGKPIISNPIGNMPEFISNWENGIFINQDVTDRDLMIIKYSYALKRLKEDRDKCKEMGKNARQTILDNWTWEKVTENERKIFREILNGVQRSKHRKNGRIG
jgi:glycosyltransferase involved in cell wall biosynthesis